jgi:hypothetical protein
LVTRRASDGEAYLLPAGVDMEFEGLLKEEKEEESSMLQQYRLLGSLIKLEVGAAPAR